MDNNLKKKNNFIQVLQEKIHDFSKEYKRKIDVLENNNNQSHIQIEQLFKERDQLMRQNSELTMGINKLNDKVKYTFFMFNRKNNEFKNIIYSYKNKINEYKNKIILLKKKN